jgi:predicted nucleotidyltransferase
MHSDVTRLTEPFLADADKALGAGYTALLVGSAARGEYVTGRSDVNLLLILSNADPATLRALQPAFDRWRAASPVLPLLITRDEWTQAGDAFPIEICDMHAAYQVLRGPDLLAPVQPDPRALRTALEREFRGKLLRLRQAYVLHGDDPGALGEVASDSVSTIVLLLRCLLVLAGRDGARDGAEVLRSAGALVGFDPAAVDTLFRRRGERGPRITAAEFERYLETVARTVRYADEHQTGDPPR